MYKNFENIMKQAFTSADMSRIPPKYMKLKLNYSRVLRIVKLLKAKGCVNGLDFGCGVGFVSVLAKLHGINVIGVDIPTIGGENRNGKKRAKGTSPYVSLQNTLKKMGYSIEIFDTTCFPWKFEDDQFQSVIAFNVIAKQFMDKEEWSVRDRIDELSRITEPGGCWVVNPIAHRRLIRRFGHPKKKIKLL